MSQENVDAHLDAIAAFNRRDLEHLLGWMAEDIRLHSRFTAVDTTVFDGHAGIREWQGAMTAAWESLHLEVDRVEVPADGLTLAIGTLRAKGHGSGVEVSEPMAQLVRWRHRKGVEIAMYGNGAEALEAVGLAE